MLSVRTWSCLAVDREGNDPFEARTSRAMAIVVDTRNLPQPWIASYAFRTAESRANARPTRRIDRVDRRDHNHGHGQEAAIRSGVC